MGWYPKLLVQVELWLRGGAFNFCYLKYPSFYGPYLRGNMADFGRFGPDGLGRSFLVGIHPETMVMVPKMLEELWISLELRICQSGVSGNVQYLQDPWVL